MAETPDRKMDVDRQSSSSEDVEMPSESEDNMETDDVPCRLDSHQTNRPDVLLTVPSGRRDDFKETPQRRGPVEHDDYNHFVIGEVVIKVTVHSQVMPPPTAVQGTAIAEINLFQDTNEEGQRVSSRRYHLPREAQHRFTDNGLLAQQCTDTAAFAFGSLPSPDVQGITVPPQSLAENHCGTMRGLQGYHNSCYLDATLFSMFAFSSVFDTLLHRQRKDGDLPEYDDVQHVLRESIVNPLRVYGFVGADRILQLRKLLDKLSSTAGFVNEEKDPEEFLSSLLQQVLKADPFLHLKSRDVHERDREGAFFYQIITEKDEAVKVPQVQQLLEQSFLSADIILSEVPSCLILQMPRFGSRYKMYDMILPNLELDVTHIVENVPRECTMCGSEVAQFECKMCYQKGLFGDGSGISSYCPGCNTKVHSHPVREDHKPRPLLLPWQCISKRRLLDKQKLDLFAVVCIETSHYVAFVKCGAGVGAPWCFFDSMADRKGEKKGYNIPAVTRCPEALEWLSKEPREIIAAKERGDIPEKIRRLLGDGYLCMYQNLDMTMYK